MSTYDPRDWTKRGRAAEVAAWRQRDANGMRMSHPAHDTDRNRLADGLASHHDADLASVDEYYRPDAVEAMVDAYLTARRDRKESDR